MNPSVFRPVHFELPGPGSVQGCVLQVGLRSRITDETCLAALAELELRQGRLGTQDEAADDYRRACDLAHWINNWLTVQRLMHGTDMIPPEA